MRFKFLLFALFLLLLTACHKPPDLPAKPVIIAAPGVLEQVRTRAGHGQLPRPVDLLNGNPVRGAKIWVELQNGWVRLTVDAPGYRRKLKWEETSQPLPDKIVLAPLDKERYREVAWENSRAPRLIMLGFDGMTDSLFRAGLERHELPAFEVLLEKGSWGPLKSCCETVSAAVWTSIFTGLPPGEHGIKDVLATDPVTGNPVSLTYADVRAPRLWGIVRRSGYKVLVGGGLLMDPAVNAFGRLSNYADKSSIFQRAMAMEQPRLAVIYEEEADQTGHMWWKDMEPEIFRARGWPVPENEVRFHGEHIAQAYRNLDAWVANALQAAGPRTVILINSDHGFQGMPDTPPVSVNSDAFARAVAPRGFHACDTDNINEIMLCADPQVDPRPFAQALRDARLEDGTAPFPRITDRSAPLFINDNPPAVAIRVTLDGAAMYEALTKHKKLIISRRAYDLASFLQLNPSSGGHLETGLFFIAGSEIKPNSAVRDASIYDITPNALTILGLPVGRDMIGRVWSEVFREPPRINFIPTYGRLKPGGSPLPATQQELERLRQLGYIN